MCPIPARVQALLDERQVPFEVVEHKPDHTALQTAWDTHTPSREFAKTVFVEVDGECAMAVLTASDQLSEQGLRASVGASSVHLLDESEIEKVCPDCELGAAPPFGNLYGVPVFVSPRLREDETITFNGGTHREAIRMRYEDFERLVRPRVVSLSVGDDRGPRARG